MRNQWALVDLANSLGHKMSNWHHAPGQSMTMMCECRECGKEIVINPVNQGRDRETASGSATLYRCDQLDGWESVRDYLKSINA